jgi:hypothetical protein
MTLLTKVGKRLDNITRYILDDNSQDKWVLSNMIPMFLEAIKSSNTIQEEQLIISQLNKLLDNFEFRYNQIFEIKTPYIDIKTNSTCIIREFNENIDPIELLWHRDLSNRKVTVLEGQDWYFQMEDQLPVELKEGVSIFIPKMEYHRVIKGNTLLKIKIEE